MVKVIILSKLHHEINLIKSNPSCLLKLNKLILKYTEVGKAKWSQETLTDEVSLEDLLPEMPRPIQSS